MPRRPIEPELGACTELAITNSFVSAAVDRELERRGISVTQTGLLRLIEQFGPVTPSELERRTGLAASTLRDRTAVLVAGRYVARTRSATDGRSFVLEVTESGRSYLAQVIPLVEDLEARLDRELGGQLAEFQDMLARIRAYVAPTGNNDPAR
ncbi:MAG: MarR family transcriptional regulator [Sporichthyaceae bacterium]|nr:MarR family transcriptional regulator [Sporichthyaceae bacterium]